METQKPNSFLDGTPSGVLAFFVATLSLALMFIIISLTESFDENGYISLIVNVFVVSAGCYFIIRRNPKSYWYVLLISNFFIFILAFAEGTFWNDKMWIPFVFGWVIIIFAAISGYKAGTNGRLYIKFLH